MSKEQEMRVAVAAMLLNGVATHKGLDHITDETIDTALIIASALVEKS